MWEQPLNSVTRRAQSRAEQGWFESLSLLLWFVFSWIFVVTCPDKVTRPAQTVSLIVLLPASSSSCELPPRERTAEMLQALLREERAGVKFRPRRAEIFQT